VDYLLKTGARLRLGYFGFKGMMLRWLGGVSSVNESISL
jgi:hypothetical protein